MKKEIAKALKDLEDVWDEPAMKGGGGRLPEFEGTAKISDMQFEMSKNNKPMIVTTFTIIEPEKFEGKELKKFDMVSKTSWPFFKGFAEQIGLELPSSANPEKIESALSAFVEEVDTVFEISHTHDGDYNKVAIISDVDSDDDGSDNSDDDDDDDDDKERTANLKKLIKKHKLGIEIEDGDDLDDVEAEMKKVAKKKKIKLDL
jgi:hypothetical protein